MDWLIKGCTEKLLPEKGSAWNLTGRLKLLGMIYDLSQEDKTVCNFTDKIKNIKDLLKTWAYRELIYMGRITVLKNNHSPYTGTMFYSSTKPTRMDFQ